MPRIIAAAISIALLFCFSPPVSARQQKQMMDDMIKLDKVFIPSLALTNAGAAKGSQKALAELKKDWASFDKRHRNANPSDAKWKKELNEIGKAISKADGALKTGRGTAKAHKELEAVRKAMYELRTRNKLELPSDRLTKFNESAKPLLKILERKDLRRLELMDALKARLPEAMDAWLFAAQANFDPGQMGFDTEKTARLNRAYKAGSDNFDDLKDAIAEGDTDAAMRALKKIKPLYSATYKMYGDFTRFK